MRRQLLLLLVAVQFLTRLPVPAARELPSDALAESARFFPIVGAIVGLGAIAIDLLVSPYAGRNVSVVLVLFYLVIITGGLHEDGLADAADGFGGGWTKEQVLTIMRDSNIGSFGALAITFSLLGRFVFLASVSGRTFSSVLIAGQVLSRWTALPLARWLPPARDHGGQGARIAQRLSTTSLIFGTICMVVLVGAARGLAAVPLVAVAAGATALTGAYFRHRIGGVTGDCLGATCQITELAVYLAGAVSRA
jgi:adenosylcobinamide-GDP ribazoletransferase